MHRVVWNSSLLKISKELKPNLINTRIKTLTYKFKTYSNHHGASINRCILIPCFLSCNSNNQCHGCSFLKSKNVCAIRCNTFGNAGLIFGNGFWGFLSLFVYSYYVGWTFILSLEFEYTACLAGHQTFQNLTILTTITNLVIVMNTRDLISHADPIENMKMIFLNR